MPVHPDKVFALVEIAVEGALKRPADRLADPVRQMDVGRGDHHSILALLDADDSIEWMIAPLAELLLAHDADDLRGQER